MWGGGNGFVSSRGAFSHSTPRTPAKHPKNNQPQHTNHNQTITQQKYSGSKILFKTEVAQAVISADKAVLIKGRRERDAAHLATEIIKTASSADASSGSSSTGGASPNGVGVGGFGSSGGGGSGGVFSSSSSSSSYSGGHHHHQPRVPLPFELRAMEVLLDATVEYFYAKTQHLNWMMESIGDEIRQPRKPFNATVGRGGGGGEMGGRGRGRGRD